VPWFKGLKVGKLYSGRESEAKLKVGMLKVGRLKG
jgi:hypothetical protein